MSNASAAAAITLSEFARLHKIGANIPRLKTRAARTTGACAPTAIEYARRNTTAQTNWMVRLRVKRRISRKMTPAIKLICNQAITST